METAILSALQQHTELELRDLAANVDSDIAAVFKCCRDLEREGKLVSPRPLAYRLPQGDPENGTDDNDGDTTDAFIWEN